MKNDSSRKSRFIFGAGAIMVALLLAGYAGAQETNTDSDGFLGIPWGSSIQNARASMDRQMDLSFLTQTDNALDYTSGTFGTFPVQNWHLVFSGGKLWQVVVTYPYLIVKNNEGWPLDKQCAKLTELLTEKYGDGRHTKARGSSTTTWSIPETSASKGKKTITLLYDWRNSHFTLTYTDNYYKDLGQSSGNNL